MARGELMVRTILALLVVGFVAVGCGNSSELSKGEQETLQDRLSKPVTQHGNAPSSAPPPGGPPVGAQPKGAIGE